MKSRMFCLALLILGLAITVNGQRPMKIDRKSVV